MRTPEPTPLRRLFGYVRRAPGRYALGVFLTLGFAVTFQWIPLAMRECMTALESGRLDDVRAGALWLVLAAVVHAGFRLSSRIVMFDVGREIEYHIRNDYFAHLQRLPQSFFQVHRTGDLMSRAVNDINSVRMLLGMGVLNVVQTPVLYLGALGVMLAIDPWLTLCVVAPYPLFVTGARVFSRRMFHANLATQEQLGAVSTAVQENASGVLVVRSHALEEAERVRFDVENRRLYRREIRLARVGAEMQAIVVGLPTLATIAVLIEGGRAVEAGRLGAGDIVLFCAYIGLLSFPTFMLGYVISLVQRGLAALQRIGEVLDTVPSIRDRADVVRRDALRGGVELRALRFAYPGQARPALDGVSHAAAPGQTLGIVGPVGSGKSTLLAAIPRLLEVPEGSVFIDGVDVDRLPLELLRRSIAMVPQDSFLFSTTIAENIRFGRPDASLEEVREAARRAHLLEEVEDFPDGFDTPVGERGITLSGGQRQRVALARALLLDPAILILDDALSSVDHATEEAILKELARARAGRTCFIASHRLSAVRDADQILVLDAGKVIERGTHAQLVAAGGFYARLYRRQQLEAELDAEEVA